MIFRSLVWASLLGCAAAALAGPARLFAGEHYAFLVAVKEYDPNELNSLRFTENDVASLAATLKAVGYRDDNIVVMTQTLGATKTRYLPLAANIRKEFALLLKELAPDDTLLVSFSGHGVQFKGEADAFFCPADAKLDDRKTLIALAEVYRGLKECQAQSRLLLVDACRNEPQALRSKSARTIELEPVGKPQAAVPPGGVAALFSCSAGQQSFEDPKLQQGIFLHFVVEGLSGRADLDQDNEVTLAELEQYTGRNVARYARLELGQSQTPERRGESRGLITLSRPILPPVYTSASISMKLVLIPAGEFQMGSPESELGFDGKHEADESPQHRVRITKPFYLGVYEVTQAEYQRVMGNNPSWFSATGPGKDEVTGMNTDRFPVEEVRWYDAVEFCNKLSQLEGLRPYYTLASIERENGSIKSATVTLAGGNGYHLPTEAEWEYACRAGTTTPFHFGSVTNGREANLDGNNPYGTSTKGPYLGRTTTVGSYPANRFGLYDMHGNVWEWCQDWYDKDDYAGSPVDDPQGPASGSFRVYRGGCWLYSAAYCRSAFRHGNTPGHRYNSLGFRLALSPSGQ